MTFTNRQIIPIVLVACGVLPPAAVAQEQAPPATRTALIEQAQADNAAKVHPFVPGKAERQLNRLEEALVSGLELHPFFESAYAGGGFTLGAGYAKYVSPYNVIDLRGSITLSGYKRIEAAFLAPRLFNRRGVLTVIGGWREATQVGFYGIGTENTSKDDRANYSFDQPYGTATLEFRPTRQYLVLGAGVEVAKWNQGSGSGSHPSVDEIYTPDTLQGLGAQPTYVHTQGTVAFDSRPSPGYARSGTYLGATFNDFYDQDGAYGFRRTDVEAIQHISVLRDTWVLSLHARAEFAGTKDEQIIPFYMLPSLGGGSSLRGFTSWRFRDKNALLLQADWRIIVNRFLDTALFYDAGRVGERSGDLTDSPLKSDYGIGFRFHGLVATPLRIDFAKSNEGLNIVFSAKAAF